MTSARIPDNESERLAALRRYDILDTPAEAEFDDTDDVVVRHGMLSEGMPFLGKPFTARQLTRNVREVLDSER